MNFWGTGISAYIITGANKSTGVLNTVQKYEIPANTGLYLEGTEGTVAVPVIASADAFEEENMLVGVTEDTDINQIDGDGNTNYILTVKKEGVAVDLDTPVFLKVNGKGNTVKANKAYLRVPNGGGEAREMFWFAVDESTSVNDVKAMVNTTKGEVYDLQGRRVANPMKGLYIVNGKKVIY